MLQFTDDTLLHRQPAVDHVEFDPTLEGEAVDELLMASTRTRSATRSPPGFYRRRLPSRARSDLPGQTFQMLLDLSPDDDCFRQRFRSADFYHGLSPELRQPMKEDGLSTDKPVANSTPENRGWVLPCPTGKRRSRCVPLIEAGVVLFVVRKICILQIVLIRSPVEVPFLILGWLVNMIATVVLRGRADDIRS